MKRKFSRLILPFHVLLLTCAAPLAHAVPYASGITTNAGSIFFYLNEDVTNSAAGDNVKVIFDGGGAGNTNNLGTLARGQQSFPLGAHTTWEIQVTKNAALAWTKITQDNNQFNAYFSPGGVAVNRNPSSLSLFGRIYVSDQRGGTTSTVGLYTPFRTTTEGIYVLNPDCSDALGQGDTAKTAGITFTAGTTGEGLRSPWKIEVGPDNYLYIADYSTNTGTIYRADPDVNSYDVVLGAPGSTADQTIHTSCNGSPMVRGTTNNNTLQVWAIDGQWPGAGNRNRLLRWDINSGPFPYTSAPAAVLGTAGNGSVSDVQSDLDIAPDGKFFISQNRAAGTAGVYDATRVNVRVYDIDGTTLLWDSLAQSLIVNPSGTDIFVNARAIAVSPDDKMMAVIINSAKTWIVSLTNGVPDITTRTLVSTDAGFTATSSTAIQREVAFDLAGNLYCANNSHECLRSFSPGGSTTAITRSSGTFEIVVPPSFVTITTNVPTTTEGSATPATLTLTRTGSTASPLTVNYTTGGTAVSGVNYTALPGTITFAAGQTTTNLQIFSINDSQPGPTTTVIVSLAGGTGYGLGSPSSATASILDVGTPTISLASVQPLMAECATGSKATFQLTRLGSLAGATTVTLNYSGVAAVGTDFNGPASITFAANASATNLVLTPILTSTVNPVKNYTVTAVAGGGYAVTSSNSASGAIYSANLPPAPVVYSDEFDTDTSASWQVNYSSTVDGEALFNYDYSLINGLASGIPEAPSSSGGFAPKRGLRLRAHLTSAAATPGVTVSPLSLILSNDYRLRFDFWMNYNGPLDVGGTGSSQHASFGVGVSGTSAPMPSNATGSGIDGIWFATATDGDVGETSTAQADYAAIVGSTLQPPSLGYYSAGLDATNRGNFDPYYALWGDVAAPAAQITSYPQQTTKVRAGALGMAWHCVTITKQGDNVTWDVDGRHIANVPIIGSGATMSDNFFLGFFDWFTSANGTPNLMFALYDNVRVEQLAPPAPNVTSVSVANGTVTINFTDTSGDTAGGFTLVGSSVLSTLAADYTPVAGANVTGGGGIFQATAPVGGSKMFYRIRH